MVLLHGSVELRYEIHGARAEYCSPSCRNVENVRRSRERRSEKTDRPGPGRSISLSYKT